MKKLQRNQNNGDQNREKEVGQNVSDSSDERYTKQNKD